MPGRSGASSHSKPTTSHLRSNTNRSTSTTIDPIARSGCDLIASLSVSTLSPSGSSPENARKGSELVIQPTLDHLPFEIKERIVEALYDLELESASFDDDDSDIEEVDDEEFNRDPNSTPSKPKQDQPSLSPSHSGSSSSQNFSDPHAPVTLAAPMKSLIALSHVNRCFYQLCRPFIWKELDLQGNTLSKLKRLRSEIISHHSEYIRKLWWRVSIAELEEFEDALEEDVQDPQWDMSLRSQEFLGILNSCPNLSSVDLDLAPTSLDDGHNFIIDPSEPMSKFILPISRLTNLTEIGLTAPETSPPFSEEFLVRLIKDMVHLRTFKCCSVDAHSPNIQVSKSIKVCQSPLGLHLASLSSLKELDLDEVKCFDLSWSLIPWKGALEKISLDDCSRTSIRALHEFCAKFSNSLLELELSEVPCDLDDPEAYQKSLEELEKGEYLFELPCLRELTICNELPKSFLTSFRASRNIKRIELGLNEDVTTADVESWIRPDLWPSLKSLTLLKSETSLSDSQFEGLELFYHQRGVSLDVLSDDDDDDDSEISLTSSIALEYQEELEQEWD